MTSHSIQPASCYQMMPNSAPAVSSIWAMCEYVSLAHPPPHSPLLQTLDNDAVRRSDDTIFLQRTATCLLVSNKTKLQSSALCYTAIIPAFKE